MLRGENKKKKQSTVVVGTSSGGRALELSRARLICVGVFFLLCFVSINARLVELMVSSPHPLPKMFAKVSHAFVEGEEPEDMEVTAVDENQRLRRGDIVDRNGVLLATSLMTESAFANPKEMKNPAEAAHKLAKVVDIPEETLRHRIERGNSFVWIKRHLSPSEQQAVNTLGIPGVYFLPEERRVYPYGNLFSHVLGYVNIDNNGLAGMEKQFDHRLNDKLMAKDALQLSLDMRVQHILHDEVKSTMEEFDAIGAVGAVADVKTGEILGMVSLPDYDPHDPGKASKDARFNRATLGVYEMGSTFKTFTLAMALESGAADINSGYDATHPLRIARHTISDSHGKKRWLSVPEIYAYSSNIGTAKMLLDVGIHQQKQFMEKLGMFEPLNLELPEVANPLTPAEWREINAITISYGHGISVTPMHLIRGIATAVGGGLNNPLTLLKNGNAEKAKPARVFSEETSAKVAQLMRLVVQHGTGSKANIEGYRVGGKTGTAEKINANGRYNKDNKMASFVATFPADKPQYVILVMVDEPKGNKSTYGYATGGWIAAPAVGRVVERMGPLLAIEPSFEPVHDAVAEQYWVENNTSPKKPKATLHANTPPVNRGYLRAVSY